MSGPPGKTIPLPTGGLEQMRADLKALQRESRIVEREMARSAKKGVAVAKDLLDKKKKIDAAIRTMQAQMKRLDAATAADSRLRGAPIGTTPQSRSRFRDGIDRVMELRHVMREARRVDQASRSFRAGGPDIDKAEGVDELLHLGAHIPGPVGAAFMALHVAMSAVLAIVNAQKEERRGLRAIGEAIHGGRHVEDPDEVMRRNSRPVEKSLGYVNPDFANNPAFAPNSLGNVDEKEFRERFAARLRNENAGFFRTLLSGLPLVGGYVQQGGHVYGLDDEAKINQLVEEALSKKVPELISRAKSRAALGDFYGANKDLADIRAVDPRFAPGHSAEDLWFQAQSERKWAQHKSLDAMGIRHIQGRDE